MSNWELIGRECVQLAKGNENEIGWLPGTVYEPAGREGRLIAEMEGEDLIAFALIGKPRPEMKIFQTLVEYGSRREYVGAMMVEGIIAKALELDVERLSLHCAIDLEANRFWGAMGFSPVGMRRGATLTRRDAMKWQIVFPKGEALEEMVTRRMNQKRMKAVAEMFGIREILHERLKRQFRRKFFGRN